MMIMTMRQVLNLGVKKVMKIETSPKAKVYACIAFCFVGQGAIECTIRFRIDSHTIKRGSLK